MNVTAKIVYKCNRVYQACRSKIYDNSTIKAGRGEMEVHNYRNTSYIICKEA